MKKEKPTAWRTAVRALQQQVATVSCGFLMSSREKAGGGARASSRTAEHRFVSCVSVIWTDSFHGSQWLVESPQCESQRFHLKVRFQCFKSRPEELFLYFLRAERLKCLIYSLKCFPKYARERVACESQFPSWFPSDCEPHHSVEEGSRQKTTWQPWSSDKALKKLCDEFSAVQLLQSPHRSHHCNPNNLNIKKKKRKSSLSLLNHLLLGWKSGTGLVITAHSSHFGPPEPNESN